MRSLVLASLLAFVAPLVACEREPTIVVRFDAKDLAAAPRLTAGIVTGDATTAPTQVDAGERVAAKEMDQKATSKPTADSCAADSDCVIVPEGCCDCANGGRQRALAKRAAKAHAGKDAAACENTMCTMMVSTDPTCGKRVACVSGACVLRDARADEVKKRIELH